MPLVLHDNALSSNAQKVRFLLAELGQTAELREVPFAHPRPDWHLAVNPLGGIPAIVWDGFHLAESNTVLRYHRDPLGRHAASIPPISPIARPSTGCWTRSRPSCVPRSSRSRRQRSACVPAGDSAPRSPIPRARRRRSPRRCRSSSAFERLIDDSSPWACCGRFTIADVAATPILHRLRRSGLSLDAIPRLVAWAGACCERPAWATVAATAGV